MQRRDFLAAGGALAASFALPARAAWPEKPVRLYIPFSPGGESDIGARLQQGVFRKLTGQELVIESRPGAGGALAWSQLNTFPGDGYSIMGTNLPHLVLQPLEGNVQYKTDDIVNVHFYHYTPDAIIVRNESPFRTYQDLLKAAREQQDKMTFAGSALNSANHLAHTRLNKLMGTKTTYVPFKGTGDLVSSLLGGHVSAAMSYNTLAISQKSKVRMLAVAAEKRLAQFPDVPTFKELGGDWVDGAYRGCGVPKSASEDVRKRVSDIFSAINKDPEFRQKMAEGGFELIDVTYDKMAAFMAERRAAYMEAAKLMGLAK
ncbi:MAG TPA: tripartite tricarboxylate transporter substrate binding protein [Usitatibacteraceae bacterium]|jgi:tripartite-type tricarboxylate transporter receptor subunit TctC|nr:tripartite tricarboxylate transporter substrate binding protein [Usitatibacteraceae bacterium]